MQVSVESDGGLKRRMKVQVPAERVDQEVDSRLRDLGRKAKLPGFRPGKVPFKVMRQQYGDQVRAEVINEVVRSTWSEALEQESLRPAGGPEINEVHSKPGEELEYEASFEIYPEIELESIAGETVERPKVEITEDDVDAMLENLRSQHADWKVVERGAEEGDQVRLDFEGRIDGEVFEGGSGEDVSIELGAGRLLKDFEEGLKGAKAGDDLTLKVNFPEDYGSEDLAGKQAEFSVKVHEVQEKDLPELNDEFCEKFGITEGGVDKLREEVKDNMGRELDQTVRGQVKEAVMEKLLAKHEVDVPQAMVDQEIESLKQDTMQRMGIQDPSQAPELPNDMFQEQASRRVKLGLLMGEVIKKHELKPEEPHITKVLERLTAGQPNGEEMAKQYRANPQAMQQIQSMALEEQVVDALLGEVEIKDVEKGFRDVMNFQQ
ncbi:trigger factor [Natronospira proteinivora]|uniref:Trigger factor n=1 Tax=Natronospira proteinivora TaxID=1807133 RepID=A0ABT1G705_9GAMM|nr:trigger factor [Natronospira proteinivora]MCP1727084.1 trigger factor [Natronospira proteinivora]